MVIFGILLYNICFIGHNEYDTNMIIMAVMVIIPVMYVKGILAIMVTMIAM